MALYVAIPDARSDAPISEVVEEFLTDCQLRNLSPRTVEWYGDRLARLAGPFYDQPLSALTMQQVRAALAELADGRAPSTVNGHIRTLKTFLNWADGEDYPLSIRPRRLPHLKEPTRVPPILTLPQMQALLAVPDKQTFLGYRDFTLIALMLYTGIRLGEVRVLEVRDVSLPYMRVRGKGDKERTVALSAPTQGNLRRYLRTRQSSNSVRWPVLGYSHHGSPSNSWARPFRRWSESAPTKLASRNRELPRMCSATPSQPTSSGTAGASSRFSRSSDTRH